MEPPVDDDAEVSALALPPPAGLRVRRFVEAHGDGPFRSATTRETCEITFAAASTPVSTPASPARALLPVGWVVAAIAVVTASVFVGGLARQIVHGLVLMAGVARIAMAAPRAGAPTLAIDVDHVRLPYGGRLALADVRRIDVVRVGEAHAVQVVTPDGDVTVAATEAAHARYIADELQRAYLAHLRHRR